MFFSNGIKGLRYNEFFEETASPIELEGRSGEESLNVNDCVESFLSQFVDNKSGKAFGDDGVEEWDDEIWTSSYEWLFQRLQS